MGMDWRDGVELINKAFEKRIEQREWDAWVSLYPSFDKTNFIPFERFKSEIKPQNEQKIISTEEIIFNSEEIKKIHQGTHEGVVKESVNSNIEL